MVSLKEAKEKFEGEWIAFLIKTEDDGRPMGEVLDHDKDKRTLHERLRQKKVKDAYITYAGPFVRPGYEVMFL